LLVHSREFAILVVVILLAAAGSQLPRLVRALGEAPRRTLPQEPPTPRDDEADEQTGSPS
jgi:hypothetical protein